MKATKESSGVFPALLKHWRRKRGMSQLDLALEADVSSRHLSFLETGRARPSREMILRLSETLALPLRDQNEFLLAAGFAERFATPSADDILGGPVGGVIARMMEHHEPYPLVVMDRAYDVLRLNRSGAALLPRIVADPTRLGHGIPNAYHMLFDPGLARPFLVDWERSARLLLSRVHRESLERNGDRRLQQLLRELLAYPGVPRDWQEPDLSVPSVPFLALRFRAPSLEVNFLTTLTVFSAPQNVTLDELCIESYFPLDERTERACIELARAS